MAFANECLRQDINYQRRVLFIAQDIDHTVGCMCYIALSLMGCPGYVVVGDSLAHPALFHDERGLIPVDNGNVWYTPMVMTSEDWTARKFAAVFGKIAKKSTVEPQNVPDSQPAPVATPVKAVSPASIPPKPKTPSAASETALDENEFGQLTFF